MGFFSPPPSKKNRVSYPTLEKYVTNYPYFIYVGVSNGGTRNIKPSGFHCQSPKSKVLHHSLQLSMVLHDGLQLLSSLDSSDKGDAP